MNDPQKNIAWLIVLFLDELLALFDKRNVTR